MSARTRDWLKFGTLVAITFVFGLAFASALNLPKRGGAAELAVPPQAVTAAAPAPVAVSKAVVDLGNAFVSVTEHVRPTVVFVRSDHKGRADAQRLPPGFEDFLPQLKRRPQIEQGSGSGFIISSNGLILTNNHVVSGADRVIVRLYDKREFSAKVVGADPATDVAVIKIEAVGLPAATLGNSDSTRVGEWVLAIGNPMGEQFAFTVTAGIVSAKGRLLTGLQQSKYAIQDFIQTDAAINPGNSGGPLVNIRGDVIGINAAIASETGLSSGYGFAIPINLAHTVMEQLIRTGHVERAVMGVAIRDAQPEDAEAVGLKDITGVVVNSFTSDDSPAKRVGIMPGDVIVALDGSPVSNTPQLQQRVGFKKPGETVEVTVLRQGGVRKTYTVRLARAPMGDEAAAATTKPGKADPASTMEESVGIAVQTITADDARDPRFRSVIQQGGGVAVTDVSPDGPAFQRLASVDDQGGPDVIVQVNGTPTRNRAEFHGALAKVKPGNIVTLQILSQDPSSPTGWTGRVVRLRAR
jgi:serine protease Do